MKKYILSQEAENDLTAINAYTIHNYGFKHSQEYITNLLLECQKIVATPSLGNQNHMSKKQVKSGLKKVIAGKKASQRKHYIFYKENPKTQNIDIIGFIHTSRDIKRALQNRYFDFRAEPTQKEQQAENKRNKGKYRGR